MQERIQLKSFKGTDNYLKQLSPVKGSKESSKTYSLNTSYPPKCVYSEELGSKSLEILCGPNLFEKKELDNTSILIKSIDYVMGYGWTITLDEL